jgi:hypothetical protein
MRLVFSRTRVVLVVAPYTRRAQGDRRSDPHGHRTRAGRDAAVPRWHLRRQHPVTAEHLFKVASFPCAHCAEPPHHCHAARHGRRHRRALIPQRSSHPITRALSIGPLGAPSFVCCPTRALHSPELRPPRPSPLCAAVGCLPTQTPSTNDPLVSMPSSPRPCTTGSTAGLAGIGLVALPHGQGPHCRPPSLFEGFSVN